MWRRHKDNYRNYVTQLEEAVTAIQSGTLDQARQQKARQAAHTLKGSLGSFGLIAASQAAEQIEQAFQSEAQLSQHDFAALSELIHTLRRTLEQSSVPDSGQPAAVCRNSQLSRLLVVDDDAGLAEQLGVYACAWGLEVHSAGDPAQARRMLAHVRPDVVLLDLCFPDLLKMGLACWPRYQPFNPPLGAGFYCSRESR